LERYEEALDADQRARLYRYEPAHLLRRRELDDLFDTTPDLSGADLDVSRYIRSGEERDVRVFWRPVDPADKSHRRESIGLVARDELCPVPVADLRDFVKADRAHRPAYAVDYLRGVWRRVDDLDRIAPGMTLLLASSAGGYEPSLGWSAKSSAEVEPVSATKAMGDEAELRLSESAEADEDESLSLFAWKSIATHGREAGREATSIARALGLPEAMVRLCDLVGRWHDAGKAHEDFQGAIRDEARREAGAMGARRDLAKAPEGAWRRPPYPRRPGFRHELVSTLLIFELLRRAAPSHPALLGSCAELLEALGMPPELPAADERLAEEHPLAREIAALSVDEINLLLWLVCSHHGKVRVRWTSSPLDQEAGEGAVHGVCEGDAIDAFGLACGDGGEHPVPAMKLSLSPAELGVGTRYGASWGDRVASLLRAHGPFTLAYLEALIRAADVRASMLGQEEPRS